MQQEAKLPIAGEEHSEYSKNCSTRDRYQKKGSKINFSQVQLLTLEKWRKAVPRETKSYYKQVAQHFKIQIEETHKGQQLLPKHYDTKSFKAICEKIRKLQQAEKEPEKEQPWDQKLDNQMLVSVSTGMQWIGIQNLPEFKKKGLTNKKIKQVFQADIRYKFGVVFRKYANKKNWQKPTLSGILLKCFLDEEKMQKTLSKYLSMEQMNSIKQMKGYFIKSLCDSSSETLGRRSKKRQKKAQAGLIGIKDQDKHLFLQTVQLLKQTEEFQTKTRQKMKSQLRQEDLGFAYTKLGNKEEIQSEEGKGHFIDFSESFNEYSQEQFQVRKDIVWQIFDQEEKNSGKLRKAISCPQIDFEKYSTSLCLAYKKEEQKYGDKRQTAEEREWSPIRVYLSDQQYITQK